MTLPPFPSQDLAKLVLGYLAEEQLMTAYDEFLQTSPYLDALRNEYDRILMTSLKNILAEYRAVRIYVETCKPFLLRKKLMQCTNLLEIVKLLVNYIDINKLQTQDVTIDKSLKQNLPTTSRHNVCEFCCSLGISSCVCKKQNQFLQSVSEVETSNLETSVEATALKDLPGNHVTTRKKHSRILEKDLLDPNVESDNHSCAGSNVIKINNQETQANPKENPSNNMVKVSDTLECRDKIEEFNNVLIKVCNNSSTSNNFYDIQPRETWESRRSNGFLNFASGVSGHEYRNTPVPDSSTSDNSNVLALVKDNTITTNNYFYTRMKSSDHQKIKIISDVKVSSYPVISSPTSTPSLQSIVINGTPAYSQKLPGSTNNYTKDQIMAMPTFIVVPSSKPSQKCTMKKSKKKKKVKTKTEKANKILGPLVIDVTSPVSTKIKDSGQQELNLQNSCLEPGLIKTVDTVKYASVPKDLVTGSTYTNTPQVAPPERKSSTTPRRDSHIRILDFSTPKKILHEINEKITEENKDKAIEGNTDNSNLVLQFSSGKNGENNNVDLSNITGTSNLVLSSAKNGDNNIFDLSSITVHKIDSCQVTKRKENSSIKIVTNKKNNWDADLRAFSTINEETSYKKVKKPKVKNDKKKSDKVEDSSKTKESDGTNIKKKTRDKRKGSPKSMKAKRRKLEEEEEQYNETLKPNESKTMMKPNFHIVVTESKNSQEYSKSVDNINKSNHEDASDTPEAERLTLQNEIGAKLNISELLETPYKQAIYDIQMDTPRYLEDIIPDYPVSDVKITNIPTPRFLDTPIPKQATPYASRGTDYSSGSSYYKPDEQDCITIPSLEYAVIPSKEKPNTELLKETIEADFKKNSRPVRKCTKNVSYKTQTTKIKEINENVEVVSICSDSSGTSSLENCKENTKTPKMTKANKSKIQSKPETKKRLESLNKKNKSPVKANTFMKIKPRRPTPKKENNTKGRKINVLQNKTPTGQSKLKASGKDKLLQKLPVLICANSKSRRKSSTPRKLHCTKQFNSESSVSPEVTDSSVKVNMDNVKINVIRDQTSGTHDSDTDQIAVQWSDDVTQDKPSLNECEDISKIKEYIESSTQKKPDYCDGTGSLQVNLIKRGFDVETAKIIERDLLDTPVHIEERKEVNIEVENTNIEISTTQNITVSNTNSTNESETTQDAEDVIELSGYECNEESENFINYFSDTTDLSDNNPVKLKEAWTMEVCIEDGLAIRLKATNFNLLYDNDPEDVNTDISSKETELAVKSITNLDNFYSPIKDSKSQCYQIFDSTLTSLDTPIKSSESKIHEDTEIDIVVEEEREESIDKMDLKKKNNTQDDPEESSEKITKQESQYLFTSTNIQNIDIESVLEKLHGP